MCLFLFSAGCIHPTKLRSAEHRAGWSETITEAIERGDGVLQKFSSVRRAPRIARRRLQCSMAPKRVRSMPSLRYGRADVDAGRPGVNRRSRSLPPSASATPCELGRAKAAQDGGCRRLSNTSRPADLQLAEKVSLSVISIAGMEEMSVDLEEYDVDRDLASMLRGCLVEPWHGLLTPGLQMLRFSSCLTLRQLARQENISNLVCTRVSIPPELVADELIKASGSLLYGEIVPLVRRVFQNLKLLRDPRTVAWSLRQLTLVTGDGVGDAWLECLEILATDRRERPELGYLIPARKFLQDLLTAFRIGKCLTNRTERRTVVSEAGYTLELSYTLPSLEAWMQTCFPGNLSSEVRQVYSLLQAILTTLDRPDLVEKQIRFESAIRMGRGLRVAALESL